MICIDLVTVSHDRANDIENIIIYTRHTKKSSKCSPHMCIYIRAFWRTAAHQENRVNTVVQALMLINIITAHFIYYVTLENI